ncbi:TMEM175 family protein [Microbacterium sp. NPDC087665]|uniref:TMEM175 family protein n=1 Tax=Microbacterium sp. NPDC087665 TaxID=3364194 RepID=UPI00382E2704
MAEHRSAQKFSTERFKAFVDAVVAIAMTLLILPLMEAVSDAGSGKLTTTEFFDEHSGQLLSFALSFLLIATFWMGHHSQYRDVEWITAPLMWINVAWMATIVWLPVPTAMLGQIDSDPLQKVVYIGTLITTQLATLAGGIYLVRHPELSTAPSSTYRAGVLGDLAAIILFAVALVVAVLVPSIGYAALFVMLLNAPVSRLVDRVSRGRDDSRAQTPGSPE